jgi:Uma2 family endonuclease
MATADLEVEQRIEEPQPRRWTRDEYYRLGDLGMFEGQRVERLDGEIIVMSPQKHPHAAAISLATSALIRAFGPDYTIRPQLPLILGGDHDPEPDLAVIRGSQRDYHDHPSMAVLVIEVADATLRYDRKRKALIYSRFGLPDYWIVNLIARQVEVHRNPHPDGYRDTFIRSAEETISPLLAPAVSIAVADLLP